MAYRSSMPAEDDRHDESIDLTLGSQAAFRSLYERYGGTVYRYARSRLRDPVVAEDVTSEVFLKAWRGREDYRGGSAGAWLIAIARRAVVDATRRPRMATASIEQAAGVADGSRPLDEEAVAAAERAALLNAVARLDRDQHTVIELQLAGWTGPEIAEALGKSHAAIKMLRYRAVHRLRALLDADPRETSDD